MKYKDINDYEIIYMIRENESEEAEKVIYQKYLPLIKDFANKYFSRLKNICEFDDLVQEGYIGLNSALLSYCDSHNALFYTFASICIERQIKNYSRRMLNKKSESLNNYVSLDEDESILYFIEDNSMKPDTKFENNECINYMREFKNSLDLKCSTVFELRYNGFTYKEIAQLLDITLSTVDGRLSKIKKLLQK